MGDVVDFNTHTQEKKAEKQEAEDIKARKKEALTKLPGYRGEVASKTNLRGLPDLKAGDIFWVDLDDMAYVVAEKKGHKVTLKALDENATLSTGISIYEMNKKIVSQEPLFDFDNLEATEVLYGDLAKWFEEETNDTYYLLYGRDINYLSLFKFNRDSEVEIQEIIDSIHEIGDLISIDYNTTGNDEKSIEIWIRTENSKAELLYLFPYDRGLINI